MNYTLYSYAILNINGFYYLILAHDIKWNITTSGWVYFSSTWGVEVHALQNEIRFCLFFFMNILAIKNIRKISVLFLLYPF